MKRPALLIVAVLMLACTAGAAEDNWRIEVRADNGAGMAPSPPGSHLGVYLTSVDGWDAQDGTPYAGIAADLSGTASHVAAVVPGQTDLYRRSIKVATWEYPSTVWEFYVAGNVNYAYDQIRIRLFTVAGTVLPPPTFNGWYMEYALVMLDNKGIPGTPANGTMWYLPIPEVHSSTIPFWDSPLLPAIKLSTPANAALAAEGYKLALIQGHPDAVIPEPAGMLALGSGLVGLAGYAIRRRKP